MKQKIILCGILTLLAVPTLAAADICRWKDASGQTHFSESAPRGVKCENVPTAFGPSSNPNQEELSKFVKEVDQQQTEARKKADEAAQVKAEKKKRCEASQQQLAKLEGRSYRNRVGKRDDKGQWTEFTEAEANERAKQHREEIQQTCS